MSMSFASTSFFLIAYCLFSFTTKAFSSETSITFMQAYEKGLYNECIFKLEKIQESQNLSAVEKLIYAECLFHFKKYQRSAFVYNEIIQEVEEHSQQAAERLLDIYSAGEKDFSLKPLISYFLKSPQNATMLRKMISTLISNYRFNDFISLYSKYPIHLDERHWSILIAHLKKTSLQKILMYSSLQKNEKELIWAKFELAHGKPDLCLEIVNRIIQEDPSNMRVILFKMNVLWQTGEKSQTYEMLPSLMENNAENGYRISAKFLFEKGEVEKAIQFIHDGIRKNYPLYDMEVFYMMSQGEIIEAVYKLEKYWYERKLRHRYFSLSNEILSRGYQKEYWLGIKKLSIEIPEICQKMIQYQIKFDISQDILTNILKCQSTYNENNWHKLLFQLDSKRQYSILYRILKDKKLFSPNEKFIFAKSLFYFKKEYAKAIEYLQDCISENNFIYTYDANYIIAQIYTEQKKFLEALDHFKAVPTEEGEIGYLHTLIFLKDWEKFKKTIDSNLSFKLKKEKKFLEAIWNINQGRIKESNLLLEDYLFDPGRYGNKAVYFLFVLKYFKNTPGLVSLLKNLSVYPIGLEEKDWNFFEKWKETKIESEFSVFLHYWYARYLLYSKNHKKANEIFKKIILSDQSGLIKDEVEFYRLTGKLKCTSDKKGECIGVSQESIHEFIQQFPVSPFRIFMNP